MPVKRNFRECWMCVTYQEGQHVQYHGTKCEQCRVAAEQEDYPAIAALVDRYTDAQWCPGFEPITRAEIEKTTGPDWEGLTDDYTR